MVWFYAQYGFPCRFSLAHVPKAVVVCGDLKAGVEMVAVASYRRFKVRESVVDFVEVHVVQTALMPGGGVVR